MNIKMKQFFFTSKLCFLFLFCFFFLKGVKSPSPNTEITYDSTLNTAFLPNEFPDYTSYIKLLSDSAQDDFKKLRHIIPYLSFPEQMALVKSYKKGSTDKLFDFSIYKDIMESGDIINKENQAISDYITEHEKMLSYGLGCLKAVSNQYLGDSDYNEEMKNIVHQAIEEITQAQTTNNQCQAKFLKTLQDIVVKQRGFIFELTSKWDTNAKYFYKNDKDEIIGFKYTTGELSTIANAFKEFAECQILFTSVLASSSMKAQVAIANMDGCKDYENPNSFAGNSSDIIENPKINYRGNGDIKGINDGHLVRSDQKTMNGYYLNHGFGFGKAQRNNGFNYLSDENKKLIETFTKLKADNALTPLLEKIVNGTENIQPFGGLIDLVAYSILPSSTIQSLLSPTCNSANTITYGDYSNSTDQNSFNSQLSDKLGFKKELFELYWGCVNYNNENKPIVYIKAEGNFGKVFDFFFLDKYVGKTTVNTIQSCFGVFSAGGKDDKDACRDVITKDCGVDLDYKCKKSGLYDYINAHPTSVSLPYNCTVINSLLCAEYITKYFIGGSVIIKPSAFVGYNLYASSTLYPESPFIEPQFYATPQEDTASPGYTLNSQNSFSILYTTDSERDTTTYKYLIIDKSAYTLIHDSGLYLKYKISMLMLIIFFTII